MSRNMCTEFVVVGITDFCFIIIPNCSALDGGSSREEDGENCTRTLGPLSHPLIDGFTRTIINMVTNLNDLQGLGNKPQKSI